MKQDNASSARTTEGDTREVNDWIALVEAESLTGYHPKYIKQLVIAGKIMALSTGRGRGHGVRVSRGSLLAYKARQDERNTARASSPAHLISSFLAPTVTTEPPKPEDRYARVRYFLIDSFDAVSPMLPHPCVCVTREMSSKQMSELAHYGKLVPCFTSPEAAAIVSRALNLEINSTTPPPIRHGDTLFVAHISTKAAGFAPKLSFVMMQLLA